MNTAAARRTTATVTPVAPETEAPKPDLLEKIIAETEKKAHISIDEFLPKGVPRSRILAAVRIEAKKNPAIMECTPVSIVEAITRSLRWGLEIGDTVHLVPYNNKGTKRLTAVADYKGLAQLMVMSGAVRAVEPTCVYEGEHFQMQRGDDPKLEHIPFRSKTERGRLLGAYVLLRRPFGVVTWEWMSIEEIDEIRQAYSHQWKQGPCPDWYAKKTVTRRAAKLIPKDPKLADAFRVMDEDERAEFSEEAQLDAMERLGAATGEDTPATTAIVATREPGEEG